MISEKSVCQTNEAPSKVKDLFNPYCVGARPFLKWAGGKSQLLEKFEELYPVELKINMIKHFYEPFLGSGAVFFNIAQQYEISNAFLYDNNEELILTYKVIQEKVSPLLELLYSYQKRYSKMDKTTREKFYYNERREYNLSKNLNDYVVLSEECILRAAQLIFLNRTCFNGLYRVNSKGEFNSPMGDYENPRICDESNLIAVSEVLQIAQIRKADFREVISDVKEKSFVYFDPPYRPISKTASFNSYSKGIFADNEQKELANVFDKLNEIGVKIMLSNSDPKNVDPLDDFFDKVYSKYHIRRIQAKRMINSNAAKRGPINEIIVTNYPVSNG